MIRFVAYALPLLLLLMAVFGFTVDLLDLEPRAGSLVRLALFEQPRVPALVVLGAWTMEACGLLALFLLAQGRCGTWWLDGLVAGWLGWVFRGPLLVVTIVIATRQPQDPWWRVAFAWWILYSVCGLALALLARRSGLGPPAPEPELEEGEGDSEQGTADSDSESSSADAEDGTDPAGGEETSDSMVPMEQGSGADSDEAPAPDAAVTGSGEEGGEPSPASRGPDPPAAEPAGEDSAVEEIAVEGDGPERPSGGSGP